MAGKNTYYGGIYGAREWSINADTANTAIDLSQSNVYNISLSVNTTISFLNPTSSHYIFVIEQTVGSNTITWPDIKWIDGIPPVLSTAIGDKDVVSIIYDGSEYYGFSGKDFSTAYRLLDYYPDAAAAYSLRDLSQEWIGQAVVRVRRSSDNAERDFTSAEITDGTLVDFCNTEVNKYTSDFSVSEDLTELSGTGAAAQSVGGVNDTYRFTLSGGLTGHQTFLSGKHPDSINTYKASFDIYIPSSNSAVNGFTFLKPDNTTVTNYNITLDQWVSFEYTTLGGSSLTRWIAAANSTTTVNADGDVFYLKNIVVTQLTADGHVVTWYDQSGNANDATQAVAANQPKIVNSGSLITLNGRPALTFDGIDDSLRNVGLITNNTHTVVSVFEDISTSSFVYFYDGGGAVAQMMLGTANTEDTYRFASGGTATFSTLSGSFADPIDILSFAVHGTTSSIAINGTLNLSALSKSNPTVGTLFIGCSVSGSLFSNIRMTEFLVYASDKSADRIEIETYINSHYTIY